MRYMLEKKKKKKKLAVLYTCLTVLCNSAASCSSGGWESSPPHSDHLDSVFGGDGLNSIASIDGPHKGVLRLNSYDI